MRIEHLLENSYTSNQILKESCDGLSNEQRIIVEGIYNELSPLIEASLTPDQIKNIFSTVEKNATAAGTNRTALGKGVDVAKQANDTINKIGKWLQDTTPVKGFDQKFEQLKGKISQKFPALSDKLSSMGEWAKANPGKTAAIIGVLTSIAALAGGPVGGAIAGQILKGSAELLKGEKLSTAVGKGMKAAAVGWLAGKTMDAVGDMISGAYQKFNPVPISSDVNYSVINVGNGLPSTFQDASIYGTKQQLAQFDRIWKYAAEKWEQGDFSAAEEAFDSAREFAKDVSNSTLTKISIEGDPAEKIRALNQALAGLSAAAQGAATGATAYDKQGKPVGKESYYTQDRPLSEGQVYLLFNKIEQLNEGPIWDKVKGAAGSVAGKVAQKAQTVGTNLTTSITADKLNKAWVKAGSPTDSNELINFLKSQGVDSNIIAQTYKAMKLPLQKTTDTVYAQVKTDLAKLDKKGKRQLAAYLKKQLGIAQ